MGLITKAIVFGVLIAVVSFSISFFADGKVRLYYPPGPKFSLADIPDLTGKVALVTGANVGLGFATSLELARKGCTVYVAARTEEKAADAADRILAEVEDAEIEVLDNGLDLSSLESIKAFAEEFLEDESPLDILVNNAGVMMTPYSLTKDGHEMQFGTNHLGHFALTMMLMPAIKQSKSARIVTVSSLANTFVDELPLGDRLKNKENYDPSMSYGYSKLANILFASELSDRLGDAPIYSNSAHPGFVDSSLSRHLVEFMEGYVHPKIPELLFRAVSTIILSPTEGALTQLYLATSPEVEEQNIRGQYYIPTARRWDSDPFELRTTINKLALDKTLAKKLWEFSVDQTKLDLE